MSDKVLIKTSEAVSEVKEKVSVISYQYKVDDVGFEVNKSSIPIRQDVGTHRAELFINPQTKELFYEYEAKTQEELDKEVL